MGACLRLGTQLRLSFKISIRIKASGDPYSDQDLVLIPTVLSIVLRRLRHLALEGDLHVLLGHFGDVRTGDLGELFVGHRQ